MSITLTEPAQYATQLTAKAERLHGLLQPFAAPGVEIYPSPAVHYRMRAEFRFWREQDDCFYAMTGENGQIVPVDSFPVACERINSLMPALLQQLKASENLRRKLFQVDFLAATTGDAVITLAYHRPVDETWQAEVAELHKNLGCSIIGRSRGKKIVLGNDFVTEQFTVDSQVFTQRQPESAFSQPNAAVNQAILEWAVSSCRQLGDDLLELYCGNGNFTLPLSRHFDKVLATEVSKASIHALQHNVASNHCDNIALARLSSEEFTQALHGVRPFRRLAHINLADYNFSTVIVDPPRAGLDNETLQLISGFDNILYISCNPDTLTAILQSLCKTHHIKRTALFDQFPYTHHMEAGVFLQRKSA